MILYAQWWIMFAYCFAGTVKGLTCTCGNIEEGQDVECQCDTVNNLEWYKGDNRLVRCVGPTCIPSSLTGYTFSHTGSTYTITIEVFSFTNCEAYNAKDTITKENTSFPYCPVLTMTKPTSGGTINIEENTPFEFICNMTSGYPAGTVEWYVAAGTPNNLDDDVEISTNISSSSAQSPTDNQEYITTSILTFYASRSYTRNRIYCKATNKPQQTPLISQRKPQLNILYYSGGPTITEGSSYRVLENAQGQLSCVVTGGNPVPTVTWKCYGGTQNTISNGTTITRTVTWTAHRANIDPCTCQSSQAGLQTRTASTDVTILYPPSAPTFITNGQTITGDIKLIENSTRQIRCESIGSPDPTIVWEKPAGSSATSSAGQVLSFTRVSKTMDNGTYTCRVSNVMDPTGQQSTQSNTSSSSKEIIVLYPPSMLNFFYGNLTGHLIPSKTIDVIKGDTFSIGCKSMDGEPEPTIKWNGQSTNNPILTVHQIQESQTGKACTSTNQMLASGSSSEQQGRISDSIRFNILVPPTISKCEFYNNKTNNVLTNVNTLMVLEGGSFTLTCSAAGKPSPDPLWSGPTLSLATWSLPVNDVTRQRKGAYTFSATSVLVPSFQPSKTITANETITIEILYPPVVDQIDDVSRVKGSTLTVNCPYTEGFPTATSTQWKRDTDLKTWNNKLLTIQSVQKSDAGRYTCEATNTMQPSGDTQSTGSDEKHFVLTVLYEASVTSFYVDGFEGNAEVTVDEGIQVMFKCSADSFPTATITLKRSSVSLLSNSSNILDYPLSEASCQDAGTYSCAAQNVHNTEPSMQTVRLFVKCSPRSADAVNQNRTSEKNESFTFTFNAIAYPIPVFMWKKWVDDDWKPLQNDNNVQITSSGFQSNLTITRVRQTDFGQYLLVVKNEVGELEQGYQLEPYDEPDVPTEFRHVETQATQSTLQLEWKPGYNGGPPQTFYIKYKQSSSQTWSYVDVSDNGEQIMRYQLTGLKRDTEYQLIIYSSNIKGNSSESDTVTAKTKGEDASSIGPLIGGAVGGGFGIAIIVIIVIFVLRRYRFNKGGSGDKKKFNGRTGGPPNDDDDNSEDIEIVENAAYISAGDVEQARPETHKKPVGSSPVGDIYAQVNKKDKKPVGGATGGDIYAEVKKKDKKDKKPEPKQKPKKGKGKAAVQGDIYENAPGTSNDKVYANADANTYEETQIGKTPAKKNVNKDGLIYADLTFNDQDKGDKKLVIIGDDDRTPYAQVDFTKKADPLPDSDPE